MDSLSRISIGISLFLIFQIVNCGEVHEIQLKDEEPEEETDYMSKFQ